MDALLAQRLRGGALAHDDVRLALDDERDGLAGLAARESLELCVRHDANGRVGEFTAARRRNSRQRLGAELACQLAARGGASAVGGNRCVEGREKLFRIDLRVDS